MSERTFLTSKGESWEWEETPETVEALRKLHETVRKNKLKENESKGT